MHPGGVGGSGEATGSHWIKYGDVSLTLDFDETTRRATIQGKDAPVGNDNVLFVDDVDSATGARVVGTMAVARAMAGSAGQIAPTLRSSPRIMSFLRCDAGKDSPNRAYLESLCLQNVGADR